MMSLHDQQGGRKYLTREEHIRFLLAADRAPRDVRAFCHTLGWSGCRISEALALTAERIDVATGTITFETLKKRQRGLFRGAPVEVDDPLIGKTLHPGIVPRFDEAGAVGTIAWPGPDVGAHNEEVFGKDLGFTRAQIDAMRVENAI